MQLTIRPTYVNRVRIAKESEHVWVRFQKHDRMAERVPSRIPIAVESATIVENVSP